MKIRLQNAPKEQSRRTFLKLSIAGTAAGVVGGSAWLVSRKGVENPPPDGVNLSPSEYAVLGALIITFLPNRSDMPTAQSLHATQVAAGIIQSLDPTAQAEVRQLLAVIENAFTNFVFGFRPRPFTEMTPEAQVEVLNAWGESTLAQRRAGYVSGHSLAMASYFSNKAVWPSIGYPGPPVQFWDPNAPVWRGDGPRAPSLGRWTEADDAASSVISYDAEREPQ